MLRVGAVVYLLACLLCLMVHTPMGSNIERYAVLLAGPLLLCGLAGEGAAGRGRRRETAAKYTPRGRRTHRSRVGLATCAADGVDRVGAGARDAAVAGSRATSASYYAPVERFLSRSGAGVVRVEVPLTRSHWEAALLAPSVSLARGWEKQLEERYDSVLLGSGLTAAAYGAGCMNRRSPMWRCRMCRLTPRAPGRGR